MTGAVVNPLIEHCAQCAARGIALDIMSKSKKRKGVARRPHPSPPASGLLRHRKPVLDHPIRIMKPQHLALHLLLAAAFAADPAPADAQQASARNGTLSGHVSNSQTRNMLDGVKVDVPSAGRSTYTDQSGSFEITGLPEGNYDVLVSANDFEEQHQSVAIEAGKRQSIAIELVPAGVVTLAPYTVAAEREGNAQAVSKERVGVNVRTVMALDSDISATVPNMNIGELVTRMSGASGSYDQGTVNNVSIRGMNFRLTRLTFDGLSSVAGVDGRRPTFTFFSGSLFQQMEIIKGPTPDMSADSIGGTINLVTRSPLSMQERRRMNYEAGFNVTAPYSDYKPEQQKDRNLQPYFQFGYAEVFDVLGGKRNLGVSLNTFYGENQYEIGILMNQYQTAKPTSPVYAWDRRATDSINNRHITGVNLKLEYQPSPNSTFFLTTLVNREDEPSIDLQSARAFSNRTIATLNSSGVPTGNGAILPDYTDKITEVRAVNGSNFVLRNYHLTAFNKNWAVTGGGEHHFGPFSFDYRVRYNREHNDSGTGKKGSGGDLTMTAPVVGWVSDLTDPSSFTIRQTAGPDIHSLSSYTNTVRFTKRNTTLDSDVFEGAANASYEFNARFPVTLQAGVALRHHVHKLLSRNPQQWDAVAAAPALPSVFMPSTPFLSQFPIVEPRAVNLVVSNPALWQENVYYSVSQTLMGNKGVTEDIAAQYAMAKIRADRLTVLAGVRFEQTEDKTYANVQVPAATAAQIPDPAARAVHDWDHRVTNKGSYDRAFPSVHLTYNIRRDLVARASWTTSFGRPDFTTLMPTATINNTAGTVTTGNPGVGPQYAKNVDLKLTYYIRPAGFVSAGYFRKSISDYLLTTVIGTVPAGGDNGYDGNYAGYDLRSTVNAGTAKVAGWEFDYRQQMIFLPGLLKGLELAANYTILETNGDFGGASTLKDTEVAGFVPESGSASVSYRYKKFGTRLVLNYVKPYLLTYTAAETERIYNDERSTVSLNVNYRWRKELSFYCQINNLFQQTQDEYVFTPDRLSRRQFISAAIQFGVKGQF